MSTQVHHLRVFANGPNGGNPLLLVLNATNMTDASQQQIAARFGHESGFISPCSPNADYDFEFRFWVPEHEMEMCGHATIGAVWLLEKLNLLSKDSLRIKTKSGFVEAKVSRRGEEIWVEISQRQGVVISVSKAVDIEEILSVLGVDKGDLAVGYPVQNSQTSRIKTPIPLASVDILNSLQPEFERVEKLCEQIGSTGLYPYAIVTGEGSQVFSARQFPKNSGYKEDAATGIAASALAFALLENGLVNAENGVVIKQGEAMGAPSKILIQFRKDDGGKIDGCWIGGSGKPIKENLRTLLIARGDENPNFRLELHLFLRTETKCAVSVVRRFCLTHRAAIFFDSLISM